MRLLDKIKGRLELYTGLIKHRKEIKELYRSFDEITKKDFLSILKLNLIRSLKPYFLFEGEKKDYNFYSSEDKALIFDSYIFKPAEIKQNFQKNSFLEIIRGYSVLVEEILITKAYEDEEVKIESKDIVLDCGANIGIFSIYASKKAEMVYAFEPGRNEITSLHENKTLNNCNNIKIIPKAILDNSKGARLVLWGVVSSYLVSKEKKENKEETDEEDVLDIETISIDEFVKKEGLEKVDFIKMDIEGSERKALLGAKETLKKFKPKLALSIYHKFSDFYKLPLLIKRLNPDYKIRVKNKKGTLMTYAY
ncbi:MAG: FkbM family methyltransferase [Candidatus Nealsonbacteria bacterium]|nr:FkbM family methyltransferase [Candidatus Nealsonbacteria bacterium]